MTLPEQVFESAADSNYNAAKSLWLSRTGHRVRVRRIEIMQQFLGRRALVTGAASGIGRALAQELARHGCDLLLVDVNPDGLQRVAVELVDDNIEVQTCCCDLSDAVEVARCAEAALGNAQVVDLLVNNAGIAFYGPTECMTPGQWQTLMQVNLMAPIQLTGALLPHLLTRPDAHIVNMCSISGLVAGGRFAAYHTSKFGLIGYTEAIRAEYGRRGLGVTAICPGPVTTALYKSAVSGRADREVPVPPRWLCTTPERVASTTLKAIRRNKRQVLLTPMAHGLFQLKRFAPGLIDFVNQFSRKKKQRRVQREAAWQQQAMAAKSSDDNCQEPESVRRAA
jgi:short-subunit dehydrogenase